MAIRGGISTLHIAGKTYDVKGEVTYNINNLKIDTIVGANAVHGQKVMPQEVSIEGKITDDSNLDLAAFCNLRDVDIILSLASGKTVTFSKAWYTGDGKVTTDEGEIAFKFTALRAQEA